ncbi:hypothetical protein phiPsa374_031 [Pseudomonas phage phiPsa374]|uniref:Uncharacterized protein n=3 Tax=Otagovirus TaxID=2560197 RepID=A0A7G9V1L2_9CAUD|nr:hypothetical protein CF96_gp031 [Pseudomonas phage phiPsa374]YP_010767817.1 hypothetical protein QGX20_gp031 [Pseudomonas phage phiPsa300]YP_010767991.1 hypothetical protein QGX21_gp034 [Pseudomonas phage phiPsa315]AHJ87289.1 hypothetical protein phiPsa374_031 [Pseudomonas phage phiPsa374]QNO00168.1 hypothetical protein phiPsa300_031 [Pseudomonas phage phiPsa300]QNO00337.1 hypothetical protein phiPsa315_034 [Pseudomonas phage phiPsa315]
MTVPLEELKDFQNRLRQSAAFSGDVEYGLIVAVLLPLNRYVEEIERVKSLFDSRAAGIGKVNICDGAG